MFLALFSFTPALTLGVCLAGLAILLVSTSMNAVLTTLAMTFYMLVPRGSLDHLFETGRQLLRMFMPEAHDRFLSNLRKTFQYYEKDPPEKAIYLWHPHGILSMTPLLHTVLKPHSRLVCLSIFHRVPFLRDLFAYIRAVPSDLPSMREALEEESISVVPGGVNEMMKTEPGVLRCVIKNRSGVFRLALETGTAIVPVLTYGENELFSLVDSPMLRYINQTLYDSTRMIIPWVTFSSFLNWLQLADTPLPPIRTYAGRPITVKRVEVAGEAEVESLRNRYLRHVQSLFRRTAPKGYRLHLE